MCWKSSLLFFNLNFKHQRLLFIKKGRWISKTNLYKCDIVKDFYIYFYHFFWSIIEEIYFGYNFLAYSQKYYNLSYHLLWFLLIEHVYISYFLLLVSIFASVKLNLIYIFYYCKQHLFFQIKTIHLILKLQVYM